MFEAFLSLILTSALLLGSPGPAPLALAATGATFGVRRSLPFLFGILSGLAVAVVGAALGLSALFVTFPKITLIIQVLGACYLCFIAYKIATAPVLSGDIKSDNSPSYKEGFILNLLNPKAYAAFFAVFSQFLLPLESSVSAFVLTGGICFSVAVFVDVIWLCLGGVIGPLFAKPKQARVLRVVFAVSMLFSVVWVFLR